MGPLSLHEEPDSSWVIGPTWPQPVKRGKQTCLVHGGQHMSPMYLQPGAGTLGPLWQVWCGEVHGKEAPWGLGRPGRQHSLGWGDRGKRWGHGIRGILLTMQTPWTPSVTSKMGGMLLRSGGRNRKWSVFSSLKGSCLILFLVLNRSKFLLLKQRNLRVAEDNHGC